jgi:hypothetical protein
VLAGSKRPASWSHLSLDNNDMGKLVLESPNDDIGNCVVGLYFYLQLEPANYDTDGDGRYMYIYNRQF